MDGLRMIWIVAAVSSLIAVAVNSSGGNGASLFVLVIGGLFAVVLGKRNQAATIGQAVARGIDRSREGPIRTGQGSRRASPAERLRELSALHDAGMVTASEYDAKRQEILAEL